VKGFDLKMVNDDGICISTDLDISDEAMQIMVDGDADASPGTIAGELCVRGGSVASGYWRQPELTDSVFRDGWFHTGDVVQRDSEGWYRLVGRKADIGDLQSLIYNKERGLAIAYLQVGALTSAAYLARAGLTLDSCPRWRTLCSGCLMWLIVPCGKSTRSLR
jgi:hypothetical protein